MKRFIGNKFNAVIKRNPKSKHYEKRTIDSRNLSRGLQRLGHKIR